jgi:hypothetical protein
MSNLIRYLLTVDSTTGAAVKVERLGESGELTEVPVESLPNMQGMATTPSPRAGVSNVLKGAQPPGIIPGGPPGIIPGGPSSPGIIPGGPPGIIPGGPNLRSVG